MASEDEIEDDISDAYEDYLNKQNDTYLVCMVARLLRPHGNKLEDYEREHLIRMIQNLDYTGKDNPEFEDARKEITG